MIERASAEPVPIPVADAPPRPPGDALRWLMVVVVLAACCGRAEAWPLRLPQLRPSRPTRQAWIFQSFCSER